MALSLKWERPLDKVPFPNVWTEFSAKESKNSDKEVKYWIQDLPEDRFQDALDHMKKFYLPDEPFSQVATKNDGEKYIEDNLMMWRSVLKQRMTLICMREGSDEIVGMNVIDIVSKGDTFFKELSAAVQSRSVAAVFEALDFFNKKVPIFEKYNVDIYMSSMGLSVAPTYRGLGLGQKLLEARKLLAAPFDIKLTSSFFGSDFSNRIAAKTGFRVECEYTFDELDEIFPGLNLRDVQSKQHALRTWVF